MEGEAESHAFLSWTEYEGHLGWGGCRNPKVILDTAVEAARGHIK